MAESGPKALAQIPLLPLALGAHADVEDLLRLHWRDYFNMPGEFGFTMDEVRAGRIDLDDDGDAELVLMLDKPNWLTENGKPFLVATWVDHRWLPVGWGWGDDDNIFVTAETFHNWHALDAGKFIMRWTDQGYRRDPKGG